MTIIPPKMTNILGIFLNTINVCIRPKISIISKALRRICFRQDYLIEKGSSVGSSDV